MTEPDIAGLFESLLPQSEATRARSIRDQMLFGDVDDSSAVARAWFQRVGGDFEGAWNREWNAPLMMYIAGVAGVEQASLARAAVLAVESQTQWVRHQSGLHRRVVRVARGWAFGGRHSRLRLRWCRWRAGNDRYIEGKNYLQEYDREHATHAIYYLACCVCAAAAGDDHRDVAALATRSVWEATMVSALNSESWEKSAGECAAAIREVLDWPTVNTALEMNGRDLRSPLTSHEPHTGEERGS